MTLNTLPMINALLNTTSALLLLAGYISIRRKQVFTHRMLMIGAFSASTLFLISYLYYHAHHGATRFPGMGWVRIFYFGMLISHTFLAVVIVPLVLRTLFLAVRNRFEEHRRWARWTFPLWLYVSITGVGVYWMLYQMDWS